ncbi:MAG TPA: TetR/AcrR family transcriptional regulator [Anaerolineales bacterium]|jgi:AcrR family transcriptional regulator|nr:TetR/AcrR family transcriptional regulator [Anaerolineales bacterium]
MSPRSDVSEERKNQILDAATEVFVHKGFDKARMDDIVDETGLSKGTLYWYFKSKSDIIIAILDRIFQTEFDQLEAQENFDTSATQAFWQFAEMAIKDYTKMIHLMPVAYEFLALAFRNKYVQKALKQYFDRYMHILVPIIQRGIDSGEFRPVDAREAAIAAGAIFEGTILLWVYDKSLVDPGQHIRSGIKLLLEGIVAQ